MSPRITSTSLCSIALFALLPAACLDPLVSDDVASPGLVLPAGTEIPSGHDVPEVEAQIAANDGVPALIPRISAFAEGQRVHFWNFGPTPDFAAPLFMLAEPNAEGNLERIAHSTIIDAIPGQSGYSPYWSILYLEVTDQYKGELITSFAAIEEAQELGLILPPVLADFAVNCPIVASDVVIEVGGGVDPIGAPSDFYWRGMELEGFELGPMPLVRGTEVPPSSMYVLSREGQEPLSEPERGVDFTGDGDTQDSNNIFSIARSDAAYTPLCQRVEVTVPIGLAQPLIDITLDEANSGLNSASDLFNPGPVAGTVVAFDETDSFINCPQQMMEGSL
jgi:hypothetical protein